MSPLEDMERTKKGVDGLQRSIYIGNTSIRVTDILQMIARGCSYDSILARYENLTFTDIMATAQFARDLIQEFVVTDGIIKIEGEIKITARNGRIINITKIREDFPRAYEPWKENEDNQLVSLFKAGTRIEQIAKVLRRQKGAIASRLKMLGHNLPDSK